MSFINNLFLFFTMVCGINVKYLDIITAAATNSLVSVFSWTHTLISFGYFYLGRELLGHRVAVNFLRTGGVRNVFGRLCIG